MRKGSRQAVDRTARRAAEYTNRDGHIARDEYFFAEQNARLVKNAEEYYRQMFHGEFQAGICATGIWRNSRRAGGTLENQGQTGKIIVWAHNSHLGDARATEMARARRMERRAACREKSFRRNDFIGFTTYAGTVAARRIGMNRRSSKKFVPRSETVTKIYFTKPKSKFFLDLRASEIGKSAGPSAARTRYRRNLPTADRARKSLFRGAFVGAIRRRNSF